MIEDVDVLIIGGGVVGNVLMRALPTSLRVLLVDDKPISLMKDAFDARSIALSQSSIQILKMLEIWPLLEKKYAPIEGVHVSEKGRFGHARLSRAGEALGAVVEMSVLSVYCAGEPASVLGPANLVHYDSETRCATVKTPTQERVIRANIIVGADGAHSFLRTCCQLPLVEKDYHQQALVANIGLQRPHQQWAYERFTEHGPLAMLPMTDSRAALIWVNSPERTALLNQLSDEAFLKSLQAAFGYRLGRFLKVGKRSLYPLFQKVMPNKVQGTAVFIGNAAHTLHPIAGQGLNLGLRDAAMLAQCIKQYGPTKEALVNYEDSRKADEQVITISTDNLIRLFGAKIPGLSMARGLGLLMLDNSSLLKQIVSRYASGYGGVVPDLVCGIVPQA